MGRKHAIHPKHHQEIVKLYQTGNYAMIELAKMFGATNRQPVKTILKQNNILTKDNTKIQGNNINKVYLFWKSGMSKHAIALKMNVSQKAITTAMATLGINYKSQARKYTFNKNVFDTIDTEEKSYWLGFIYADGHTGRTSTRVALAEKDKQHLLKLRKFINGNMPLLKTQYGTWELAINNKYTMTRLRNLGIVPYRSHFHLLKSKLPKKLIRHFIRGYVDGDGCISKDQRIIILARRDLIVWLIDTLHKETGASKNKIRNRGKILEVGWGGRHIFNSITEYLYKDTLVYLDRKMERVKNQADWCK